MKNINVTFLIIILAITTALTGCTKDPETTPDAGTRSAFLGKWLVTPTKLTYEVNITADPNSVDGVFISNFAALGTASVPASAYIDGSSIILDANQVIGDGITVNGSGNLSGTKIIWNYTLFDGADLITVSETYTKE
jgi:hypothetical protein